MGQRQRESDPKYQAHKDFYAGCQSQVDLAILECVPEYNIEEVVARELPSGWACKAFRICPRLFGFANARPRSYGLAWKESCYGLSPVFKFEEVLDALQATPMMSAKDFFYLPQGSGKLTPSQVSHFNLCFNL